MFGPAIEELGADDLAQIAESAIAGRVGTLLIEADRHIPGRIDVGTGRIEFDDLADPGRAGPQESRSNCDRAERMPQTGIAAIYQAKLRRSLALRLQEAENVAEVSARSS